MFAAPFAKAGPDLEFTRLGVAEGLTQNSVYALLQDRRGFLWAATGDGLARYDGQGFAPFRGGARGMPATQVRGPLLEDRWGRFLFSSEEGLLAMNPQGGRVLRLSTGPAQDREPPQLLGIDATDTLWAVQNSQLFGASLRTGGCRVAMKNAATRMWGSAVLGNAAVFFSSANGLHRYDRASQRINFVLPLKALFSVFALADGRLALNTGISILLWNPATPAVPPQVFPLPNFPRYRIGAMVEHRQDGALFFVVGGKGLLRLDLRSGTFTSYRHDPTDPHSIPSDLTLTLLIDRSENLWVGTEGGGLSRADLKAPKFSSYPSARINRQRATGLMVKSVLKQGDDLLIGTFDSGLYVVDAATGTLKKQLRNAAVESTTDPHSVNILMPDSAGRIWSNIGQVLGHLDPTDYRFRPLVAIPYFHRQARGNYSVYAFLEVRRGTYLLGTNHGLVILQEEAGGPRVRPLPLPGDHYYALQTLPDGSILAGRLRGGWIRFRLHEAGATARLLGAGFTHTGIRDFYLATGRPLVYAASENGLIIFHLLTGATRVLDEGDGLSNSHLYGILAESDSSLWVSTNRGLNQLRFGFGADGLPASISVMAYGQDDGLQSAEFNSGAFGRSPDGTFLFGGINGVNWFRPDRVRPNPYPPSAAITALAINEKPYAADTAAPYLHGLSLRHDQNTLAIQFAALEYTQPQSARYSYKLDGFERGWTSPGRVAEARYAALPPGEYTFLLRTANADGVWNPRPLRLPVTIRAPWWMRWWARLGALLLLGAGAAYGVQQYVAARVRRRLREIEKQQAVNDERLRISRDMHDELGSGLTKIALLSEVSKQRLTRTADGKDKALLEQIAVTSRKLTEKMGEIIWTLNPAADTLDNLAAYLKEYLSELGDGLTVNLAVRMPETVPPTRLSNRQRQQILLVTKEAVNNAIKYAQASCITFSLALDTGEVRFTVADDGVGFSQEAAVAAVVGKRIGLGNMVRRMESVGGWCRILTTPGGGTAVEYGIML